MTEVAVYTLDRQLCRDVSESRRWCSNLCISLVAVAGLGFDSKFVYLDPLPYRQFRVVTVASEVA